MAMTSPPLGLADPGSARDALHSGRATCRRKRPRLEKRREVWLGRQNTMDSKRPSFPQTPYPSSRADVRADDPDRAGSPPVRKGRTMSEMLPSLENEKDEIRILIVDDEVHIRKSLGLFLSKKGYEIAEAADAASALEQMDTMGFFLVVTDISMPQMDGIALLHRVKELHPETDVILITGNVELEYAIQALRKGAFDYFKKPFYFDEVLFTIERLKEKRLLVRKAIELERLKEKHRVEQKAMLDTTLGLAQAVEEKDSYTKGHIERVARYALLIAEKLGYPKENMELLRMAGLLHDIGKVAIPEEILTKTGKLTESEFLVIRNHPDMACRILAPISFLHAIIPAVRHHHENYDGTGYPDRLKGEDIPLEARILKIADYFDAVTSARPYRKPLSYDDAVALIQKGTGRDFDPSLVGVFVSILETERPELMEIAAFAAT
jgi:putative nucleotidyltransferase with HDIG domain